MFEFSMTDPIKLFWADDAIAMDMAPANTMTTMIHDNPGELLAYCVVIALLGCIVVILRERGVWVYGVACCYVVCLAVIALVMRELMRPPLSFKFPAFVTTLHYLSTWIAVAGYHAIIGKPECCLPSSLGTPWQYARKVGPFATFLPISVVLGNKSLVFIGAGLSSIVGSLSPICTACVTRVLGRRYSRTAWAGVLVAFTGCVLIAFMEVGSLRQQNSAVISMHSRNIATVMGLSFALGALVLRSLRVTLQDLLTSPQNFDAEGEKQPLTQAPTGITGMHLLALQSPAVVLVSVVFMFATEGVSKALHRFEGRVAVVTLATCVIATTLNILGATLLKQVGSAHLQIIGKLNSIVTIAISMGFFGEHLDRSVLCSYAVVVAGVAIFEAGERQPLPAAPKAGPGPPRETGKP